MAELSLAELSTAELSLAELLLAELSLAELSLAELSLAELSLAELSRVLTLPNMKNRTQGSHRATTQCHGMSRGNDSMDVGFVRKQPTGTGT